MASSSRRKGKAPALSLDSPSFFKIVLPYHLKYGMLQISEISVISRYGDCLRDTVSLKVPDGTVRPIGLTRRNGKIWLQKGWTKFAESYSLDVGYVLLFSYEGEHSHFLVRIFKRVTVEMDYFGSAFPVEAPSFFKIVLAECLGQGGKLEIPALVVFRYGDYTADRVLLEVPDGKKWTMELTRHGSEILLGKSWPEFSQFYSLEEGCLLVFSFEGDYSHLKVRILKKNTLEMDYFSSSDEAKCFANVSGRSRTEVKGMKHGGADKGKFAAHKSSEVNRTIVPEQIEDLKETAFAKASHFKSDKPFSVIRMQPSYLSFHLKVGVSFVKKHICENFGEVVLKISDSETWRVKCIVSVYSNGHESARFQDGGWKAFTQANRLKVGDACVFEVIDKAPIVTLQVYIFRDEDQKVSC